MSELYSWGIDVIKWMQALGGPLLNGLFKGITFLGNEEFYLLLLPFVLWCLDARLGAKLVYLLLLASLANFGLKHLFAQPRPFIIQPGLNLVEASGYGLPSGHSQMVVVIWGSVALAIKKKWSWPAALVIMLLIGISRVYLGVHFPTDVLAGWTVGAIILALTAWVGPGITRWLEELGLLPALILINGFTIAVLLLNRSKDFISPIATFWGFALGHLFLSRFFSLSTSGSPGKRIVRYSIGLIGMLSLYLGLKSLFPAEGENLYLVLRFVRYSLIGLWVGLAAPLVFRLLHLSPGYGAASDNKPLQ
jgi:membrane-associated phospholipid phosphatase